MTAPRRSARPAPPGKQPLRPSSLTLVFAALLLTAAIPTAAVPLESRLDNAAALVAAILGATFVIVAVAIRTVRRRSARPDGSVVLPALVAAGLITATYVATAVVVSEVRGPEDDFLSLADVSFALGVPLAITFAIVYATLSMART